MSRLHKLRFEDAGYIEFCGDPSIDTSLLPEGGSWWNSHPCQSGENLQRYALSALESKGKLLTEDLFGMLYSRFSAISEQLRPDFKHPTFVINNYHPFHMHVTKKGRDWTVTGFYDFEAASSGNAMFDLVLNDLQITPFLGSLSWRTEFYRSYARPVLLESYRTILIIYLILGLSTDSSEVIPAPDWFRERLPRLLDAERFEELEWYPVDQSDDSQY